MRRLTTIHALAALAFLALVANRADADLIVLRAVPIAYGGYEVDPDAGFSEAAIDMSDYAGATGGYDAGLDQLVDTSIYPPHHKTTLLYSDADGMQTEKNFVPYPHIGDTYTLRMYLYDTIGTGLTEMGIAVRLIDCHMADNPNGVTDYSYSIKADTDFNNSYQDSWDFSSSGRLSDALADPDQQLAAWLQYYVPIGFGDPFVDVTLTAIGVPEPSCLALAALGALGVICLSGRRRRPCRN